jgi:hypothetical protein
MKILITIMMVLNLNSALAQADGESEVLILQKGKPAIRMWCYILDIRVSDGLGESFYRISCPDFYDVVPDIDVGYGSKVLVNRGWDKEFTVRCPSYFQMDRRVLNTEPQFELVFNCGLPEEVFKDGFEL